MTAPAEKALPGWRLPPLNFADHHRASAAEFRRRAAMARLPEIEARLLRIAGHHEKLALMEGAPEPPEPDPPAMAQFPLENPVSQARRHVLQAEGNVARQRVLLARLSADPRHALLADQARMILATLTHTLKLAREHLALELAEEGGAGDPNG